MRDKYMKLFQEFPNQSVEFADWMKESAQDLFLVKGFVYKVGKF
jgi:hypothetical protein